MLIKNIYIKPAKQPENCSYELPQRNQPVE